MIGKDNLFHFDEPNNYFCLVVNYFLDLPQLVIEVRKLDSPEFRPDSYIIFTDIEYFEGPLKWIGANFSMGAQKELEKMMNKIKAWPDNSTRTHPMLTFGDEDLFLKSHNLYETKSLRGTLIRIVAAGASKYPEWPFPIP